MGIPKKQAFLLHFSRFSVNLSRIIDDMSEKDFSIDVLNKWDEEAANMLYKYYYAALSAYAFQFVGDQETARDIIQDVFSSTWELKRSFNTELALKVYLYNAVRNKSINYLRYVKKDHEHLDDLVNEYGEWILKEEESESVFSEEVYRLLFQVIDGMPPRQREVFLLAIKGKKNKEISEILKVSIETVKTQKKRGLSLLKKQLDPSTWLLVVTLLS